jgi:hypothetical protein
MGEGEMGEKYNPVLQLQKIVFRLLWVGMKREYNNPVLNDKKFSLDYYGWGMKRGIK